MGIQRYVHSYEQWIHVQHFIPLIIRGNILQSKYFLVKKADRLVRLWLGALGWVGWLRRYIFAIIYVVIVNK